METKKLDCALIFALEEEYQIVSEFKTTYPFDDYRVFKFYDKAGILRNCLITAVAQPGSSIANEYLSQLFKSYEFEHVLVIGISGQISDDLKLGDIVIAESIDKYDYNSKVKNGEFHFSGQNLSLPENRIIRKFTSDPKDNLVVSWKEKSKKNIKDLLSVDEIQNLFSNKLIRDGGTPYFFHGRIATGETVVDDPALKAAIAQKDRKILCVDMESFGFALACKNRVPITIIRAISDTADGKKKEIDTFKNQSGVIRKWALSNAFSFFENLLLNELEFNSTAIDEPILSDKISSLELKLQSKKDYFIEKYSYLFFHLTNTQNLNFNEYNYINELIKLFKEKDGQEIITIQGNPGTGKSTLLYLLYSCIREELPNITYLNIHNYKITNDATKKNTFHLILDQIKHKKGDYIFIDGVDRYERFYRNKEIRMTEDDWLTVKNNYKKIVIGITTSDYQLNDDDYIFLPILSDTTFKIELDSFNFQNTNLEKIVRCLMEINEKGIDSRENKILTFLKDTGIKEIDWFNANLFVNRIGTDNYERIKSIGQFYFKFTKEHFTRFSNEDVLKQAADLAFKKYIIKDEKLTVDELNSPIWDFIQKSNTIKQFLIAEHLIQKYKSLEEDFEASVRDLSSIYSYRINAYFKDTLNRDERVQGIIFEPVINNYNRLQLINKPNVCYILGRIKSPHLRPRALTFLRLELEKTLREYRDGIFKHDKLEYRHHLLLIRTIYISLTYLGDSVASQGYLNYLLNDKEWDDLNRGFHLEYYGDIPYDPKNLGLHEDQTTKPFPKTYDQLSKRIKRAIDNPDIDNYMMIDIELHTIISLAINRHFKGNLDTQIRNEMIVMLQGFLEKEVQLLKIEDFKYYLVLALRILKKETVSLFDNIKDILTIKNVKRSGWNYKGLKKDVYVERRIKDSESVPDHITGAMLMALFLLPDKIEGDNSYDKNDILITLLLHDLGECVLGDIVSFNKTEFDKKEENEIVRGILALDNIPGTSQFTNYRHLWKDYFTQSTMTAQVAADIDKIEQLLQLNIYAEDSNNYISDFENWRDDLIKAIRTPIGKGIANILFVKKLNTKS